MQYYGKNVLTPDELRDAMFQERYGFTEEKLIDLNEISKSVTPFICEEIYQYDASVPLDDICGSGHPSYSCRTWGYILKGAKKIDKNLVKAIDNPNYYIDHAVASSDAISYLKIRDKYYVEAGNHRTTIAKFLLPAFGMSEINNVTVCEYKIDEVLIKLIDRLNQAIIERGLTSWSVDVDNQTKKAEDQVPGSETHIIPHVIIIRVISREKPIVFNDPCSDKTKGEIQMLIEAINMKSFFTRLFSSNPYLKYLQKSLH
ncbi:MAG: hypothetical protein PHV62_05860 [Sulfuricurvum sp.]|nr:hypothetical protein [Sulfuricurvum sp.]